MIQSVDLGSSKMKSWNRIASATVAVASAVFIGWPHVWLLDSAAGPPRLLAAALLCAALAASFLSLRIATRQTLAARDFVIVLAACVLLFYLAWWNVLADSVVWLLAPVILAVELLSQISILSGNDPVGHPFAWGFAFSAYAGVVAVVLELSRRVMKSRAARDTA